MATKLLASLLALKSRSQKGIALPEVLVAAVLLGIIILAVSPMMSYSIRSSHSNKERSAAIQAAQQLVEEIRNAGFAQAAAHVNVGESAVLADDLQGNKLYIKGTGEVRTTPGDGAKPLNVSRIYAFSNSGDMIQVTVKITWPGSSGRHVTLGTTLNRSLEN